MGWKYGKMKKRYKWGRELCWKVHENWREVGEWIRLGCIVDMSEIIKEETRSNLRRERTATRDIAQ